MKQKATIAMEMASANVESVNVTKIMLENFVLVNVMNVQFQKNTVKLFAFFFLNNLFLYLAVDTVFHPSRIIQNGMEISSKFRPG